MLIELDDPDAIGFAPNHHWEAPEGGVIGAALMAARRARRLSIEGLAERTRIPRRYLEAIEAGDFTAFRCAVYAIGFARAYARAVGVPEAWADAQMREAIDTHRPEWRRGSWMMSSEPARLAAR